MQKMRRGDEVIVIAGKDKGRRGVVTRRVDDDHVIVEGLNRVKKHVKDNPAKEQVAAIIDKDMPIHISNVAHYHPELKKAARVVIKVGADGKKTRVFKVDGLEVSSASA